MTQDSLAEVLERLQAPPLGILAQFDEARGTLVVGGGRRLELDDGGTRFFETLGIATGVHRARGGGSSRGFSDPSGVRRQLVELERGWRELFAADLTGTASDLGARLRKGLEKAVRTGFETLPGGGTGDVLRSGLGLDFDWSELGGGLVLDPRSLERSLRENAVDVSRLLLGEGSRDGLIAGWQQALRESAAALATVLESRGLGFVDLRG